VTTESDAETPATGHGDAAGGEGESWQAGLNLTGSLREAMDAPPTVYEIVGGQPFFDELVDRFYDAVENDSLLRPMYPRDMGPSRKRLAGFLAQYWGGPRTTATNGAIPGCGCGTSPSPSAGPNVMPGWPT